MYIPTTMMYHDPVEDQRLESNRPASRMEIAQRVLRLQRAEIMSPRPSIEETPVRFAHRASPVSMARFRRGISRALTAAADRIAPEAA